MKIFKKRILIVFLAVILLTVWAYFFIKINHRFPQPPVVEYPKNQWIQGRNSLELKVEGMTFMEDDEIRNTKDIPSNKLYRDEMMLIWLTFRVRNAGKTDVKEDIGAYSMESAGWSNIADPDFMQYIAGDSPRLYLTFTPGQERTFKLPYLLLSTNFRTKEWEKAEKKKYWLTFRLYPKKERIICN